MLERNDAVGDGRRPLAARIAGVREAWVERIGPFSRTPKGNTPAQRFGIRYEKKVHAYLEEIFPFHYTPSQWFGYTEADSGRRRWCQTDGLLRLGSMAVIFEVKARFGVDGWQQLRGLYSGVVRAATGASTIGLCLVCRNYDPFVPFPEPHAVIDNVESWVVRRNFERMAVLSWRG